MVNVFEHDGSVGGSVGDPQLVAIGPIVGVEDEFLAQRSQISGVRTIRPLVNVFQQDGAVGGSVGDPQFGAVGPVLGSEIELALENLEVFRI